MLKEMFSWVISSLGQVFNVFKNTKLDDGISYLDFIVFLLFIRIVLMIINHIKGEKQTQQVDFTKYKNEGDSE